MVNLAILGGVTAVFLAVTIYLGWYGYKSTKNNDQFLLGKNKANSILIALSYGATFLSTSAIIGFGGMGAKYGLSIVWLATLCIIVGTIVAFMIFGKRTRRIGNKLGAFTFADLLGKRFNSPGIRTVTSLIVLIGMPVYCAAVLIGGIKLLEITIGIDENLALLILTIIVALYVTFGGIIAVMYNDALQGGIMFVGMAIILVVTFWHFGGITEAFDALANLWADKSTSPTFQGLIANGMNGWLEAPSFGTPIWLTVVTTLLLGVGIGSLAQPQLAVRFMSAKDDKTLNKSMAIGAVFIFLILGTAFTIGPLSNALFAEMHGGMAAIELFTDSDKIIPQYITDLFSNIAGGDFFVSLFILALVCATVSTMSALLHTMGSSAGYDLWGQWKERKGEKLNISRDMVKSLKVSRICTLVMMVLVVVYAYIMPENIIAKATTIFMGLSAAALLPTFAYGLFCKVPSRAAAKASIIVGAVSWTIWALFIETGTATKIGLCKLLFGTDTLVTGLANYVDPLVIGLPLSAITLVIAVVVLRYIKPKERSVSA